MVLETRLQSINSRQQGCIYNAFGLTKSAYEDHVDYFRLREASQILELWYLLDF